MPAEWKSIADLGDHFRRHGRAVGARDVEQYAELARLVIREDVPFQYRLGARRRFGRYYRRRGLFVALQEDGETILTLDRKSENYVRALPDSTYDTERGRR
ncbi:MAG TPA: hypothetical protein VFH48_43560 [Chloroflexota bacterium]|nr:hypothetical protein [Chloroflexota bacterium]